MTPNLFQQYLSCFHRLCEVPQKPCAMDSDSAAKISQILQLTVMKICQSVVNYTDQLAVQGVVSVEADGHDVCTVTFSDSSEKEAQKPRDSTRGSVSSTSTLSDTSALEQKRNLEYYMHDAEKDGYESDVSDCDRMVIDENRDARSDVSQNSGSDVTAAFDLDNGGNNGANRVSDAAASENNSNRPVSSTVELIPTRKVSRRKASVPIKQGIRDDEIESEEDEGFESQKSRLSSQGEDINTTTDDNNSETTATTKDDSVLGTEEEETDENNGKKEKDSKQQQQISDKGSTAATGEGKKESSASPKVRGDKEKEKVQANKFKSKICESTSEKISPGTNELISRPPEVPESPSQRLSGGERTLVNSLVAKALKLWYDDDTPGGAVTDSPRRGYFAVSPRGKGAFELLHSPTSPMNFKKHSQETVSKALLFTADSEFNTSDAKSPSLSSSSSPSTNPHHLFNTSTPSAMTTARLRAMLKERAEVTGILPHSVAMPIDERESASLMQFASQVPGWIPLESLGSPEISKFSDFNKRFAQMTQTTGAGGVPGEQHPLNRKTYSCQMCQKTFVHSTNLMRHVSKAHEPQARHPHPHQPRRAFSQDDALGGHAARLPPNVSTTPRTPDIISAAMRDNRELVEKAATEAETPRRHSASDAEAAQILSSMRELVARGMESHILAQQQNENAATPKDIQGTDAHSLPVADAPSHGTASHPPAGHPDALPLSNSPRKENQFVESPETEVPFESSERNPLTPSDNGHNRLFKCLECGKRFPSHARLARHLYVCHRALIEGIETKGQVALGTRTIPISQTTSQPMSPVKMTQNGNHLCRLCGRTFTFSSNLRRHIRKMHLQSPSKVIPYHQPTVNINPSEQEKNGNGGGKVICDLCGQTYLTPADLDDHLRDMHQVIRKKLMFGSRGIQEGGRNSALTAQDQNEQTGTGRGGVIVERDGNPRQLPQGVSNYTLQAPVTSLPQSMAPPPLSIQGILNAQKPRTPSPTNTAAPTNKQDKVKDVARRSVTPQPIERAQQTPDNKMSTGPMDLSVVKKEVLTSGQNETSSSSQPVDLTTRHAAPSGDNLAVDLSVGTGSNKYNQQSDDESNADKLEASRSLLKAALQAKQDAKSQHPKLLQLLGDSNAAMNKTLESVVSQAEMRPPFSPLMMAAQMNLAFPPTSLPGGIPPFPGAPALFGSPFAFPSLKSKMSGEALGELSPLSGEEKPQKPAKRRKSMNHGYDSDGSKSPSQHSDANMAALDANFPSRVEGKRYICGLCSASFTFQTNLTRHQRKLHGKPYVRKPVGGLNSLSTTTAMESTTPKGSPQALVTYEVPPTPPIFGPVLGIKSE